MALLELRVIPCVHICYDKFQHSSKWDNSVQVKGTNSITISKLNFIVTENRCNIISVDLTGRYNQGINFKLSLMEAVTGTCFPILVA